MAGKGRINKYHTNVEPRLDEVEKMAQVMTEKQIAKTLGVAYSSFNQYKIDHPELSERLKKGRESLVYELKSVLIQKAKGFDYTEQSVTRELSEVSGKLIITKKETKTKHMPPDVAAINLLLKNYDPDNWANDPQMLAVRKEELKLHKKQIEENNW